MAIPTATPIGQPGYPLMKVDVNWLVVTPLDLRHREQNPVPVLLTLSKDHLDPTPLFVPPLLGFPPKSSLTAITRLVCVDSSLKWLLGQKLP